MGDREVVLAVALCGQADVVATRACHLVSVGTEMARKLGSIEVSGELHRAVSSSCTMRRT